LYFYDNNLFSDEKIMAAVSEFSRYAVLVPSNPPPLYSTARDGAVGRIRMVLEFLRKSAE
jgi:hypothetical protein